MKTAENIARLRLRLQYGLISVMLLVLLLQMLTDGSFCFIQDLITLLVDWFDGAELLQTDEHNFRLFAFIWKSNYIETSEALLFIITIPTDILEYIHRYNLILAAFAYQLSIYLALILAQFPVRYKSQFIIAFHKAARTINSAVIAVP